MDPALATACRDLFGWREKMVDSEGGTVEEYSAGEGKLSISGVGFGGWVVDANAVLPDPHHPANLGIWLDWIWERGRSASIRQNVDDSSQGIEYSYTAEVGMSRERSKSPAGALVLAYFARMEHTDLPQSVRDWVATQERWS